MPYCYLHPKEISILTCDNCQKDICLHDKRIITIKKEISSGDDTTDYTDVLYTCPVCEFDFIKKKKEYELLGEVYSWSFIGVIIFFTFFWLSILTPIFLIFFYKTVLFILNPLDETIIDDVLMAPFVFYFTDGIIFSFLVVLPAALISVIRSKLNSDKKKEELESIYRELDYEKDKLLQKYSQNQVVEEKNCVYHTNIEAVNVCSVCKNLICRNDVIYKESNKSVPDVMRTVLEERKNVICPSCKFDLEIKSIQNKSWKRFGLKVGLLAPIIILGMALYPAYTQTNNKNQLIGILIYSILPFLYLVIDFLSYFRKGKKISSIEEKKNEFLHSEAMSYTNEWNDDQLPADEIDEVKTYNKDVHKEPPYCIQCNTKTSFSTRFEITSNEWICTKCYYSNGGKITPKTSLKIKIFIALFLVAFSPVLIIPYIFNISFFIAQITQDDITIKNIGSVIVFVVTVFLSFFIIAFSIPNETYTPSLPNRKHIDWNKKVRDYTQNYVSTDTVQCYLHPSTQAVTRCIWCEQFICKQDAKEFKYRKNPGIKDDVAINQALRKQPNPEIELEDIAKRKLLVPKGQQGKTLCPSCYFELEILDYKKSGNFRLTSLYFYPLYLMLLISLLLDVVNYQSVISIIFSLIIIVFLYINLKYKFEVRKRYKNEKVKELIKQKEQYRLTHDESLLKHMVPKY